MGRWMDGWTGVRSQLTCVILESQKTIQHLLTVHTDFFSLSHTHTKHCCLFTKSKKEIGGSFSFKSLRNEPKKALNKFDLVFGGAGFSSVQLSCLVPLFVLEFVYPVYPSS